MTHRLGDDRKLGIVYCANRPAQISEFELSVVSSSDDSKDDSHLTWRALKAIPQSDDQRSARSARVLHPPRDAKYSPLAVFLSNPVGGPHSSCASLHAVALQQDGSAKTVELVPTVDSPKALADFPGLYLDQLPQQCFLTTKDGPAVVLTSVWRSRRVPLLISLKSGEVTSLAEWPEPKEGGLPYVGAGLESFNVLGTDGLSRIVATRSGATGPPQLVIADLSKGGKVEWKVIKSPSLPDKSEFLASSSPKSELIWPTSAVSSAMSKLDFTVVPLPKFGASEIILVAPTSLTAKSTPPPVITFPHGGPHATTTTDYSASVAALALAGYSVALINYPGSLGFGQVFVDELPPKLGTLEVEASLAVHPHLVSLGLAAEGKGKRMVMGGSHGGWITAHLTSKWPSAFDAAVMRNPVVDLPSMLYATDIPDWSVS